jgi:hypothetical protein
VACGFVAQKKDVLPAVREDECCNRGLLLFADVERAIYLSCNQSHRVDGCVVRWNDLINHASNPPQKVLPSKQPSLEGTMQVKNAHLMAQLAHNTASCVKILT